VFADLTYDLTDNFKLSGGIREFWVDNTLFGFFGYGLFAENVFASSAYTNGEAICNRASNEPNRPCINTDGKVTQTGETHRVNLTYQFDPERMAYVTYSTGFRPGGVNRKPSDPAYTSDKLNNYEVGWKTGWLDRRIRFNGAIFYEKWNDVQLGIQGAGGITSVYNVGNADVKGVEADFSWLAMDNLTLTVSGTYVDAKTTNAFCKAPTGVVTHNCDANSGLLVAASGTRLPVTPQEKANASARYKFNMGQYDSFVQAAAVYEGSTTYSLEADKNLLAGDTPSFVTLDLSGGIALHNWKLEAYIENVTDKRGELSRISQCGNDACVANYRVYPIKPMLFGVKFGQSF
jgi:outer membrane receptor protein involved in Fe transport